MKYFLFIIFLTAFVSCNKFETSICEKGYLYENGNCEDINECTINNGNCDVNAICENSEGSFVCICKTGFEGDGKSCEDIDECVLETHNCSTGFTCKNTEGSFICEDNDECVLETHNCSTGFTCENTEGSFNCNDNDECLNPSVCETGYNCENIIGSFNCNDINECENGTANCHLNATCSNTKGTFTCSCNEGYSGDGVVCDDNDECVLGTHNCSTGFICENTLGSFNCNDIDECTNGTANCSNDEICINIAGSFVCDIDECLNPSTCETGYNCENIIGSYNCDDIDECLNNTDNCDEFAICINTESSFTCTCNSGFSGNGVTCISTMDIYEVTAGEFKQCVTAGSCTSSNYQTTSQDSSCNLNKAGNETHPMNCVNWYGATQYCVWKGKRLPTEEEWEYAARGGESYIYSGSNDPNTVAWYSANSGDTTHQVGIKAANGYGLHDMSGNVREWTNSWYDSLNRVLRGGGFYNTDFYIRGDSRSYREPTRIYYDSGFRCVQ